MFPDAVNVLLLRVKPLLAVMVTFPVETRALSILIVDPVEVRTKVPAEEVLLALSVNAPAELKVIPLPNVNTEEFALILKLPDDVEIPPFRLMPELAVKPTVPAAVKFPVMVMLVGAVKVSPAAAVMPPVMALKLIDVALFRETPLAKVILSFGLRESVPLSESPFKLRAPVVVVILALAFIPFTAFASREENEESA